MIVLDKILLKNREEIIYKYQSWSNTILATKQRESALLMEYPYKKYWLKESSEEPIATKLTAIITYDHGRVHFFVDDFLLPYSFVNTSYESIGQLHSEFREKLSLDWIGLEQGFHIQPTHIPKQWGEEIWYSGIEERGVSYIQLGKQKVLLPYILSLFPQQLVNDCDKDVLLLKILNPKPIPSSGDLYCELHEKKKEVYIITNIDETAYPDGRGKMKLGINLAKRASYKTQEEFSRDMLKSIQNLQKEIR